VTRLSLLSVAFVALCGCDKLFDIDRLPDVDGDSGIVLPMDDGGFGDAAPCLPVGHDEDGDAIDDACDACPTIASDTADADGDGLPNACDRDDSPTGDRILFYSTFASQEALLGFTITNGAHTTTNNGGVELGGLASLMPVSLYRPTRIELLLGGIVGTGSTSELRVALSNGVTCRVKGSNCAGTISTNTCISLEPSGGSSDWPLLNFNARRLSLFSDSMMRCQVSDGSSAATALAQTMFSNSNVTIATTAAANVTVESIVIYGAK
jgi:hypothetical protein